MSVFRKSSQRLAIASLFAMTIATSASAAPLAPNSPADLAFGQTAASQYAQTVHLVCDDYGRCYRSRRYVRAPYYGGGYYPGSYGYAPGIVFGFGGHHYDGGHSFVGHGFGGHGFADHGYGGHGFGGHGFGGGFGGHGGGHHD